MAFPNPCVDAELEVADGLILLQTTSERAEDLTETLNRMIGKPETQNDLVSNSIQFSCSFVCIHIYTKFYLVGLRFNS